MEITPDILLRAYALGVFPMAESSDDPDLYWVDPDNRGILPLDGFHLPKRLARTVRQDKFETTVNRDFAGTIRACAANRPDRPSTWINDQILELYGELHRRGQAHSVECWRGGKFVGGLYGVSLGGAFFGESMVSFERDASKVALVHLVARLQVGGYVLLDTQFVTKHLARFGTIEVPRDTYHDLLSEALTAKADFYRLSAEIDGAGLLQSITQTS